MKPLTIFGLIGTALYLTILLAISYANRPSFIGLAPNEWGDFLAGAFGPVALFWIVLGFFQQGRELQNSVDALNLQAKELRNSVEQQKAAVSQHQAMVEINEKQLNLDIEVRSEQNRLTIAKELPLFQITPRGSMSNGTNSKSRSYDFELKNIGSDASSVEVSIASKEVSFNPISTQHYAKNRTDRFSISTIEDPGWHKTPPVKLELRSKNIRNQKRIQVFELSNGKAVEISCDPEQ